MEKKRWKNEGRIGGDIQAVCQLVNHTQLVPQSRQIICHDY